MSDRRDNRCGSGLFTLPTKLATALGLASSCSIHDHKYVYLRDKLLQGFSFKSETQIREVAARLNYKKKIKQANNDFKWHMIKMAKDKGNYWYVWPIIKSFWVIVDLVGYEVWLQGVFSDWRKLKKYKRLR